MVPLPHCVRLAGLRLAPVLLVLCAALSAYSACAIIAASCNVHEQTYQGVARRTIGERGAAATQGLIVCLTFGISVAVIDIFADVAPSVLGLPRTITVILAGCAVTPIVALVRRIERLAIISIIASSLAVAFVGFVYLHHWTRDAALAEAGAGSDGIGDALPSPQGSLASLLEAVSVINLSFLCHFNCLPLFHALPGAPSVPARDGMYRVIGVSTLLALVVYASVGILGYIAFGEHTNGNAFASFAQTGTVGRVLNNALAAAQLASLPLLVHEGVRELVSLLSAAGLLDERRGVVSAAGEEQSRLIQGNCTVSGQAGGSRGGGGVGGGGIGGGGVGGGGGLARVDSDGELRKAASRPATNHMRSERLCGVLWCAMATCIAVFAADTSRVLALVAALCGAPLMSVLPVLMLLRSEHGLAPGAVKLNCVLLAVGIAVTAASAVNAVTVA